MKERVEGPTVLSARKAPHPLDINGCILELYSILALKNFLCITLSVVRNKSFFAKLEINDGYFAFERNISPYPFDLNSFSCHVKKEKLSDFREGKEKSLFCLLQLHFEIKRTSFVKK